MEAGRLKLIWSYINEGENYENPFQENMWAILKWKEVAEFEVTESREILLRANALVDLGLHAADALHLASAVEGKADFFLTTDDKILKKISDLEGMIVLDPIRMVEKIDEYLN